jgi:anti-anti-sigma factor
MAAAQGTVRVHEQGQTVQFRVEGRATMAQSVAFRRFAEQRLAAGATTLQVDLSACTYMDSTFLGTLLFLKSAVDRRGQGEFTLVSPSARCRQLLQQMGLDAILRITAGDSADVSGWSDLADGPTDVHAFKDTVTEAHQELANLEGPAGEPFRAVMRCLDKEPGTGKAP